VTGLVSDHVAEIIIGIDFLRDHSAVWNFRSGEVNIDGYNHQLHSKDRPAWCRRVALQDDCVIPARTEVDVPTSVVYNDLAERYPKKHLCWSTDARVIKGGLQASRAVLPDGDVNIPVRILNAKGHSVTLPAGTVVSPLELVEVCSGASQCEDNGGDTEADSVLIDMVNRVDESVTVEERQQLLSLLREFGSTFSRNENDLGRTDVITHVIDTTSETATAAPTTNAPAVDQAACS